MTNYKSLSTDCCDIIKRKLHNYRSSRPFARIRKGGVCIGEPMLVGVPEPPTSRSGLAYPDTDTLDQSQQCYGFNYCNQKINWYITLLLVTGQILTLLVTGKKNTGL